MTFHKRRGQGRKYDFEGLLTLDVNSECEILKERLVVTDLVNDGNYLFLVMTGSRMQQLMNRSAASSDNESLTETPRSQVPAHLSPRHSPHHYLFSQVCGSYMPWHLHTPMPDFSHIQTKKNKPFFICGLNQVNFVKAYIQKCML